MTIVMVHDGPGATQEQYEQVGARLTDGHGDVWESEEAFQRFGAFIGPVLEELGYPGRAQLFEVHNFVK
ncbi:MAG TPA: hypothetical protein VNA28_01135 [Solirubrobacteraceae bacterium]|nr:hypothetical protein [Solirubrobacteraceae bacterium]